MGAAPAAGKQPGIGSVASPVHAQHAEQHFGQWHQTRLVALALLDVNQHPRAVDVLDAQGGNLRDAQAGRLRRGQRRAAYRRAHRAQKAQHLLLAQHDWQPLGLLAVGQMLNPPRAA